MYRLKINIRNVLAHPATRSYEVWSCENKLNVKWIEARLRYEIHEKTLTTVVSKHKRASGNQCIWRSIRLALSSIKTLI